MPTYSDDFRQRAVGDVMRRLAQIRGQLPTRFRGLHPTTVRVHTFGEAIEDVAWDYGVHSHTLRRWVVRHGYRDNAIDAGTPTVAAPPYDEYLFRRLLQARSSNLLLANGLVPAQQTPIAEFIGVELGVCVAVNDDFRSLRARHTTIVTTIPIGYCHANFGRLTFAFITDIVLAVALARWGGCECLIYLPIAQEIQLSARPSQAQWWQRMAEHAEHLAHRVVAQIGAPVTIARTDTDRTHARITTATRENEHALGRLEEALGFKNRLSAVRRQTHWATVAGYLPDVVADLTGEAEAPHVVIVDSLAASRSAHLARKIAAETGDEIDYLGFLPAPSLDGRTRMSNAQPPHALILADSAAINTAKLQITDEHVRRHWESLWQIHTTLLAETTQPLPLTEMAAAYRQLY